MPEKKGPGEFKISDLYKQKKGGILKKGMAKKKGEEAKPAEAPKPEEITAELVASREFGKKVQGYDPQEVRAFLQAVAQRLLQLEAQVREGGRASAEELGALRRRVAELEEENRRLKEQASQPVDEAEAAMSLLKHAKEAAEKLTREAEVKAKEIVENAEKEALLRKARLEEEFKELQAQVERLRSFKLELVARMEGVLKELQKSLEKYKD